MLLTSIGIYGFLTNAYQNTANKVEIRDSQIKIAENDRCDRWIVVIDFHRVKA